MKDENKFVVLGYASLIFGILTLWSFHFWNVRYLQQHISAMLVFELYAFL